MPALLAQMSPVDLVLVEGFKREAHPKIEMHRAANAKPLLHPDDPSIVAIASDAPLHGLTIPLHHLDDVAAIADVVHAACRCDRRYRLVWPARQLGEEAVAQLSDDCFAFGGKLLSIDAALRRIAADVPCVAGTQPVPLHEADGRILADDVIAAIDLPPFDNSAVDGYAVRLADLADASVLPVVGRLAAGEPAIDALPPGTARRIFTGAALPQGADTVFMQEDVRVGAEGCVRFPAGLRPGANTRARGEDVARGTCALPRGRRLRPQDLALAAALGVRCPAGAPAHPGRVVLHW